MLNAAGEACSYLQVLVLGFLHQEFLLPQELPTFHPSTTHQRPINDPSTPKMHSSTVPGHSVVTPSHGLLGFTTGPSRNMGDRVIDFKLGFKTQIWFASKCPSVTNAVTICAIPTGRNAETSQAWVHNDDIPLGRLLTKLALSW